MKAKVCNLLALAFAFLILLPAIAGCAAGDGPELAPVSGTITLDGEPLSGATVEFTPEGTGSPSYGSTDANGYYELRYSIDRDGAMLGTHLVRVTTRDFDDNNQLIPERVPTKYNEETELTADVKDENNTIDLALDTEGEIVQDPYGYEEF